MRDLLDRHRWASVLANLTLMILSLGLTYLAAEYVLLRYYFPRLSPVARLHLPDLPDVTGQTSKRSDLPHDYIAILGDSYAEGLGDWMDQATAQGRGSFHSAHVLHELTGVDVITLGRWGYGSAQAMVLKPARVYFDGACYIYPRLAPPSRIVTYFYEGNDLIDNVTWFRLRVSAAPTDNPALRIDRYLHESYGQVPWWRCHTYLAVALQGMAGQALSRWRSQAAGQVAPAAPTATQNRVETQDGAHVLGPLIGPSMHLDPQDMDLALTVFDRSLAWLRARFPKTPVTVVYLPSPAVPYRYADSMVTMRQPGSIVRRPADAVDAASQQMCRQIQRLSTGQGVRFLDATPALRAAAARAPIHGPKEVDHFNEAGYRALAGLLADTLAQTDSLSCGERAD